MPPSIVVIGASVACSTYLLRMHLAQNIELSFGRFKNGKPITLISSDYLYIGSALAPKGATSLAHRLIRHATRADNQAPHPIRTDLIKSLESLDLIPPNFVPTNTKKLFWNIDHFLDQSAVTLNQILMLRSSTPLETPIAQLLENDPHTIIFEKGLGANDSHGHTHLLRVEADEIWWEKLPQRLSSLL